MASKGPKPDSPAKAAPSPKPKAVASKAASNAPAAKAVAKTVAKPAIKPADVPVASKAPVASPADKIELPTPAAAAPAAVEPVMEKAADTAVKTIEPAVEASTPVVEAPAALIQKEVTVMEANLKNAAEKAQTLFAEANERAKAAMEKGTKLFEEANEFSKGNIEALVESGKIAAKGLESLGQDAAEYGRKQFEGATAALKSLSTVKSPTDFFKLHSDYVRSSFDSIVAQTSKNTEAMLKLAGEVAQPISNRVALAAEKAKIAA